MQKSYLYIGIVVVVAILGGLLYFVFSGGNEMPLQTVQGTEFGESETLPTTEVGTTNTTNTQTNGSVPVAVEASTAKVFKITEGPIAGATLIDTVRPTSTVVRFVLQTNGHVFDLALDSPGALPKAVSNTTIPGISRVLWSEKGRGALLQYVDNSTTKTAHLALPSVGSTTPPARIQFLPPGIADIAVSPDGTKVAYLMATNNGSDGYIANADGIGSKKLFSLPLSQLLVSWPAPGTLLVQTPASAGTNGMIFSVGATTGSVAPTVYAPGITAIADQTFSKLIYQVINQDGSRSTYAHNVRSGLASALSFDPLPERCIWSQVASSTMYCPTPLSYVPGNYVDQWHMGTLGATDAILQFDMTTARSAIVASPGSSDGGEASNILEIGTSQSGKYLLFLRKGDRSLWGVRL
jgi:hypothetical protein